MDLKHVANRLRILSLKSTTAAGSGHPTSSMSAADLMAVLMFGGYFQTDWDPTNKDNDRLIFSKGHASPLYYSIFVEAGKVSEDELMTLRQFDSRLEGHPTMDFEFTEAPTGSLGQGLGIGCGLALAAKMDKKNYKTWVLLGDSEMAEGSVWESLDFAAYNKLNNLVAVIDVNRLGQRGETMFGHDVDTYKLKAEAFGCEVYVVDGHDLSAIEYAYSSIINSKSDKPKVVVAKTLKGSGVSFLEDKDDWHGKALDKEKLAQALAELQA